MIEELGKLELEGMEFQAHHGCLEHERKAGNLFTVDFRGTLPMRKASETDHLEDALDYGKIYDCIAAEMARPSDLLEHVTGRIVRALAEAFPQLREFEVRVSKRRPPVNGVCQWSRITMQWHHND